MNTTLATVVILIETTNAIKLKDITSPPYQGGTASLIILIVFFCKLR